MEQKASEEALARQGESLNHVKTLHVFESVRYLPLNEIGG